MTDDDHKPDPYEARYGPEDSLETVIDLDRADEIVRARSVLAPVQRSMKEAGFYAYGVFDQQQRWTIASDDEAGRFDIRLEGSDLVVSLWLSSPGKFVEVENDWRRRALERLTRMTLPNVARGYLESNQEALWDEVDQGIAVRITYRMPIERAEFVGDFVRDHIPDLERLLEFVEQQVSR
jgi:hypothetical protein